MLVKLGFNFCHFDDIIHVLNINISKKTIDTIREFFKEELASLESSVNGDRVDQSLEAFWLKAKLRPWSRVKGYDHHL